MKRSGGVTAMAVLLIVLGGFGALGMLTSMAVSPRRFAQAETQLDQVQHMLNERLDQAVQQGQFTAEQAVSQRQLLRQSVDRLRRFQRALADYARSPQVRLLTWLGLLLNVAAVIAGIGILGLRAWARKTILWQAALSIPLTLWSVSTTARLLRELAPASGTAAPATSLLTGQFIQGTMALGLWTSVVFAVAWNGFLLWWFNRATVAAQFAPAAGEAAPSA